MKKLTNKARRRLGVSGRPALILNPNESVFINKAQLAEMQKNKTVARWLETGILVLSNDDHGKKAPKEKHELLPKVDVKRRRGKSDIREAVKLPKGVTGKGIETHHKGGGWYEVYVNGFPVTDHKIRKDEAVALAAEYEK